MNKTKQSGFTLVEIAIVLVIIGLLLGGILKGQELINSARVRNLADQNSGIQAAYFGFIDRYRQVPGDWDKDEATDAIGVTIGLGGNGDGKIDNTLEEGAAVWEQLSKAGFIQGSFNPAGNTTAPSNEADYGSSFAPRNAFNGALVLSRNDGFEDPVGATDRLNLHLGPQVPVNIAREIDVKVDDGRPKTGVLRLSATASSTDFNDIFDVTPAGATGCVDSSGTGTGDIYNVSGDAQDCGTVFLY